MTVILLHLKSNPTHIKLKFCLVCLLQNSVQAQQITLKALFLPSTAVNISHQRQTFAGSGRFLILADLFTFLSWQSTVHWLRKLELAEGTGSELSS